MSTIDSHRGHPIVQVAPDTWVYSDTRELVAKNPNRKCGHCGLPNRSDGHDACLGTVPGAMNACCGHGNEAVAYVQLAPKDQG